MSEPAAAPASPSPAPAARQVGAAGGLLFITAAKVWFMVAGSILSFALPHAISSAAFGLWGSVTDFLSPVSNVLTTTTIQGVSKFVSAVDGPARVGAVMRAGLRVGLGLAVAALLLFVAGAPLAASFQHDPSVILPTRVAGGVVFCYALYAVFVGAANGQRAFHKQAGLDITFATLRVALVVGLAWVTHSVVAAMGGFVAAALVILLLSAVVVRMPRADGQHFDAAPLLKFFGEVGVYIIAINLLMFVDGQVLKRLVVESMAAVGAADPASEGNIAKGHYLGVQNVARLPYQLLLAVTFVIFPLISRSTFEADRDKTRRYVRATMRYSLLVVALMCASVAARPEAVLRLLYKPEYAVGARALALLVAAYGCFALFNIACTILNGAGKPLDSVVVSLLSLAVAAGSAWVLVGGALARGGDPLGAAALSSLIAMGLGLVGASVLLLRRFGGILPLVSLVRTGAATVAALAVGRFWPTHGIFGGKVGTLASMAACAVAFLVVAVGSGELRPAELRRLRRGEE